MFWLTWPFPGNTKKNVIVLSSILYTTYTPHIISRLSCKRWHARNLKLYWHTNCLVESYIPLRDPSCCSITLFLVTLTQNNPLLYWIWKCADSAWLCQPFVPSIPDAILIFHTSDTQNEVYWNVGCYTCVNVLSLLRMGQSVKKSSPGCG